MWVRKCSDEYFTYNKKAHMSRNIAICMPQLRRHFCMRSASDKTHRCEGYRRKYL